MDVLIQELSGTKQQLYQSISEVARHMADAFLAQHLKHVLAHDQPMTMQGLSHQVSGNIALLFIQLAVRHPEWARGVVQQLDLEENLESIANLVGAMPLEVRDGGD